MSNKHFSYNKEEKLRKKRLITESVGMFIRNLTINAVDNEPIVDKDEKTNKMEYSQEGEHDDQILIAQNSAIVSTNNSGNNSIQRKFSDGGDGDDPNEDKPITLKRR